jgi:uncharacterized protein YbjT (DUF2867 family)
LGGTGFVGTELVSRLAMAGHSVRVPTRSTARGKHLLVLPTVELAVANVHSPTVLSRLLDGIEVIINLIGIANEPFMGGEGFREAHSELADKIVHAARGARVRRVLHMSALGAGAADPPSEYLRTKKEAERILQRAKDHLDVTIFRPSVIFGPDDTLANRFAGLLRLARGFIPLARAKARFAPIFVEDVAEAFMRALSDRKTFGETYELCGPNVMTLAEIVQLSGRAIGTKARIMPLPDFIARLQGIVMGLLPGKPFSLDNFKSLTVDSVCQDNGCARLGIQPRRMEGIVPLYLGATTQQARFSRYRLNSR